MGIKGRIRFPNPNPGTRRRTQAAPAAPVAPAAPAALAAPAVDQSIGVGMEVMLFGLMDEACM